MSGSEWGSPPRMRGKAEQQQSPVHLQRITPAYAGKSSLRGSRACSGRDHPRVCGEKWGPLHRRRLHPRITPAYAGKRLHGSCHAELTGITPAYAGKSDGGRCSGKIGRDHPRVCGEKWIFVVCLVAFKGSPPRMRGKGLVHPIWMFHPGITPAYAGKKVVLLGREAL